MAWANTLLDASFRGIVFDIVKTDDTADRALVEHAYPYVDGADVEDMGRGARHISVEAVFYGDDYEDRLKAFLLALDGLDVRFADPKNHPDAYLTHPVFGEILVKSARYAVHHDADNVDEATVTVEFIESTPGNPFFSTIPATQKIEAVAQHGAAATAAATSAAGAVVDQVKAAKPLSALDKLRTAMTGPILALTSGISVVLSGLDVLAYPRAWGNDISAMVGGLLDARLWGDQLVADWASIRSDLDAFSIFSSPSAAPAPITSGVAPTEAQAADAVAATVRVNAAVGLGNAASYVLAGESATPTLSPDEIEAVSNIARGAIEAAIEQVRGIYGIEQSRTITEPLKDQALALQEAARSIIAARPPLVWRTVSAPGNMRLLAHFLYGDSDRAPELWRLNGARSPFVEVGDQVHAYAR
jgi:prophage DNA circulation protein